MLDPMLDARLHYGMPYQGVPAHFAEDKMILKLQFLFN
jgi:hypothetical protein